MRKDEEDGVYEHNQLREAAKKVLKKRKKLHNLSDADPFIHADFKMAVKELHSAYKELEKSLHLSP